MQTSKAKEQMPKSVSVEKCHRLRKREEKDVFMSVWSDPCNHILVINVPSDIMLNRVYNLWAANIQITLKTAKYNLLPPNGCLE